MRKLLSSVSLAAVICWGAVDGVRAENVKGRWHLGGGFSFISTSDDIRSNAAFLKFGNPGEDGIPDSGDETIIFVDRRPDDLIARESTIDEDWRFDLNASYGVLDWFSIQFNVGYYKADLVQLDTFSEIREPVDANNDGIISLTETLLAGPTASQPLVGGEVELIPVSFSAVFRFLRDRPLNPYLGIGAGYIFTDVTISDDLEQRNEVLASSNITAFLAADESTGLLAAFPEWEGINLELEDSFEWHFFFGAEYFLNSHLAFYGNLGYMFATEDLVVSVSGFAEQVTILYESVRDTLPFCTDPAFNDPSTNPIGAGDLSEDRLVNDADFIFIGGGITPTSQGISGVCRPGTGTRTQDTLLVQGGKINLSAWDFSFGVRWYF